MNTCAGCRDIFREDIYTDSKYCCKCIDCLQHIAIAMFGRWTYGTCINCKNDVSYCFLCAKCYRKFLPIDYYINKMSGIYYAV